MVESKIDLTRVSERENYRADPKTIRTAMCENYRANPEKERSAKRRRYWKSPESARLAKRVRYGEAKGTLKYQRGLRNSTTESHPKVYVVHVVTYSYHRISMSMSTGIA